MPKYPHLIAIALLTGGAALPAQTAVVSPSDRTALEGSSFTHYPLGRRSARVQTLHDDVPAGTLLSGPQLPARRDRRCAATVAGLHQRPAGDPVDVAEPSRGNRLDDVRRQRRARTPIEVLPRHPGRELPGHRPPDARPGRRTSSWSCPTRCRSWCPRPGAARSASTSRCSATRSASGSNQQLEHLPRRPPALHRRPQPSSRPTATAHGCPAPGAVRRTATANLDLWRTGPRARPSSTCGAAQRRRGETARRCERPPPRC